MTFRKTWLPVLLLALLAACEPEAKETAEDTGDLLPTSIVQNPNSADGLDTSAAARQPRISFEDTLHNFGRLQAGERVEHEFAFRNTGGSPLMITGADGSCGCTVADYPREPIIPGGTGTMKVLFNSAGKQGRVEQSVSVVSNSVNGTQRLYIQAEVDPAAN